MDYGSNRTLHPQVETTDGGRVDSVTSSSSVSDLTTVGHLGGRSSTCGKPSGTGSSSHPPTESGGWDGSILREEGVRWNPTTSVRVYTVPTLSILSYI